MTTTCAAVKAKDWKFYFDQLRSDECMCEREKKPGLAFFYRCYRSLEPELQRALYRELCKGFEEAYDSACIQLSRDVW